MKTNKFTQLKNIEEFSNFIISKKDELIKLNPLFSDVEKTHVVKSFLAEVYFYLKNLNEHSIPVTDLNQHKLNGTGYDFLYYDSNVKKLIVGEVKSNDFVMTKQNNVNINYDTALQQCKKTLLNTEKNGAKNESIRDKIINFSFYRDPVNDWKLEDEIANDFEDKLKNMIRFKHNLVDLHDQNNIHLRACLFIDKHDDEDLRTDKKQIDISNSINMCEKCECQINESCILIDDFYVFYQNEYKRMCEEFLEILLSNKQNTN